MEVNKYVERLYNEWKEYGRIIIGLDFDDTIFPFRENFTDVESVINLVIEARKVGAIIIIYTGSNPDRYDFIKEYCKEKGLEIDGINMNVITPFGDNRKIYANIYLDDRSGLLESLATLSTAMWKIKGDRHNKEELQQQF